MEKAAWAHSEADIIIHLGDGGQDFEAVRALFPAKTLCLVRGNSDWGADAPVVDMLTVQGKRIFFAHGHTFQVKLSTEAIETEARRMGAHILLFGHTHVPMTHYADGLYLLNPGSISLPRAGRASYGVVDITDAGIVTRIVML